MKKPRILLYDIESTPNLAYVWGKWQQDVIAYEEEWYILSFSYKWLGESRVHCKSLRDFNDKRGCDKSLVKALWKVLDEADVVIAHNGDAFDQKKSNARFLYWGIRPPSPYRSIDTLKVARRYFRFNSNKLDDLAKLLRIGGKVKHSGFQLWLDCMAGKAAAWREMIRYNKQDVLLLEKVYLKLRAWIENHPNVAAVDRPSSCPKCGASKLKACGWKYTKTTRYRSYRCLSCKGYCKSTKKDRDFSREVG